MRNIPNIITMFRLIGAFSLLLFDVRSEGFWTVYFICGISDMLDGYLARKLHVATIIGGILDSIADLCFLGCCCYTLIPTLNFPCWLWYWVAIIAVIKIINQISALVIYRKILFPHTIANKVTGLSLFLCVPIAMLSTIPAIIVAAIATFAAIQEGHFIKTNNIK